MARRESIAVGGYFKTPSHLLGDICRLFKVEDGVVARIPTIMDPCAGEGEAVLALGRHLGVSPKHYHCCEMEASRFKILNSQFPGSYLHISHTDFFCLDFKKKTGVSVLYLNPPYDTDSRCGRLEERFLRRATGALQDGGILLFVVPYYSLTASASTLAKEYMDVRCYAFPEDDFKVFKQVVLTATKRSVSLAHPDTGILEAVTTWVRSPETIPVLGSEVKVLSPACLPSVYSDVFQTWAAKPLDLKGIASEFKPWCLSNGVSIPGMTPEGTVDQLLQKHYPLATTPKPAHIAAAIAAGVFNGIKVAPNEGVELPALLVKGVFDREYVTIDEKKDKTGRVKAVVQIQQPRLITTVLDLESKKFSTLKASLSHSNVLAVETMTVADLLSCYSQSLMAAMVSQCPILYSPETDRIDPPGIRRKLFEAQAHAASAATKLLKSGEKGAFLLGEIGSGKSTVALTVARAVGAHNILIMCPPHLLNSWKEQAEEVYEDVDVRVLEKVSDLGSGVAGRTTVHVLSRETAKLSHGWASVSGSCPRCGSPLEERDFSKKRERCSHVSYLPRNNFAHKAVQLAELLAPAVNNAYIDKLLGATRQKLRKQKQLGGGLPSALNSWVMGVLPEWVPHLSNHEDQEKTRQLFKSLILAGDLTPPQIRTLCDLILEGMHKDYWMNGLSVEIIQVLLTLLLPEAAELTSLRDKYRLPSGSWCAVIQSLREGLNGYVKPWGLRDGHLTHDDIKVGDLQHAVNALAAISTLAKFRNLGACNEPLYQAIPEPRRVPLASVISKHHKHSYDFVILDEAHELSISEGSAQERAGHRLTNLNLPTLMLTGSVMNGYAESLFTNMWHLSKAFRLEYQLHESKEFVNRYGYRKRILEDKDKGSGEVIEFGSQSDRVTRTAKVGGMAPGVLPLFILKHLLPISVTLHKADLALDLPPCRESTVDVHPTTTMSSWYNNLLNDLKSTIKKDMRDPEKSGKLWGALARLPSYLDLAPVGNCDEGFVIKYPDAVGGEVVSKAPLLDTDEITPKEWWLLEKVSSELLEGRNVMVFVWHTRLLSRIVDLIQSELDIPVVLLEADKVPTAKREAWINREVVKKGIRVMVCNPTVVQTGLNNLTWFHTECWMENPMCNPICVRQASGRVDRIGQKKDTRILFPVYKGTLQEQLHTLLLHKVAISMATDGLDSEGALMAAGVEIDTAFSGLSLGKEIYKMLTEN